MQFFQSDVYGSSSGMLNLQRKECDNNCLLQDCCIFIDKAMVDYDAAVRELVGEHGLELFKKGNHECTMDHFSVENTRQAQEQRRAAAAALAQASGGKQKGGYGPGKAPCKAFNYGKDGCKDNHCRDAHKCSKCGRPSHKESDCWDNNNNKGKRSKE